MLIWLVPQGEWSYALFQLFLLRRSYLQFSSRAGNPFLQNNRGFFGWVGSSLLSVGFLQLWRMGATLHCGVWASHCSGFSCCGVQALGIQASVVVARRLSSCGAWVQLLRETWDLPRPRIKPVSPELAGGFSTTAPPGKSPNCYFST